jgi:hypothetical protein
VLEHAPRHPSPGPAARRCPLPAALDTIVLPDRQLPTYAVTVIALTSHFPSRSPREIGLPDLIRGERQHLARMLASTPIRWQDGARSSSLFMLFENPTAAGRGRGRSVIRFTLDARLLEHEHHRARERFGPGAGPAQWADWRIVPLPRPRIIAPLTGSPRDTYGPQTVALRLLWLFFTRHGDQLLDGPRLVRVAPQDRRAIAEEALLPTRLIDPLLAHLVRQGAIVAGAGSRFAPADPAARAFIAEGWRRSRLASARGQRAAHARVGREPRQHPWRDQGSSSALRAVPIGRNMRRGHPPE